MEFLFSLFATLFANFHPFELPSSMTFAATGGSSAPTSTQQCDGGGTWYEEAHACLYSQTIVEGPGFLPQPVTPVAGPILDKGRQPPPPVNEWGTARCSASAPCALPCTSSGNIWDEQAQACRPNEYGTAQAGSADLAPGPQTVVDTRRHDPCALHGFVCTTPQDPWLD